MKFNYKVKVEFKDKPVGAVYTFERLSDALDFQYRVSNMNECKFSLVAEEESEQRQIGKNISPSSRQCTIRLLSYRRHGSIC